MGSLVKINNPLIKKQRILVIPLDWGLGHATRCIPIIKELISHQCDVWIGASGAQKALLAAEFPLVNFIDVAGYGIRYGKNRTHTIVKLILSIPKILIRIKRENRWFRQLCAEYRFDAVIADNRYGLYAPGVHTVFITHQLRIRTSLGSWADGLVQRMHYRLIRRFSVCWIPDQEKGGLAGELSHPGRLPGIPTRYIGFLSRMEPIGVGGGEDPAEGRVLEEGAPGDEERKRDGAGKQVDLLILLSGPEPQRSIFEKLVVSQLKGFAGSVVLVRGLPGGEEAEENREPEAGGLGGMEVFSHLPARPLNELLSEAAVVLCRPGYSTLMDLAKLGKKAILVPTPGQTEQEYLGACLAAAQKAICVPQSAFSLQEAWAAAQKCSFVIGGPEGKGDAGDGLGGAINALLAQSDSPDFG